MQSRGLDLRVARAEELGSPKGRAHDFAGSGGPILDAALKRLPISADDEALDFGCGKASAILTLSKYPFARVDGVEISPQLIRTAQENLRRMGIRAGTIFQGDAAEFKDLDRYTFFYLYNPFPRTVMAHVAENIRESLVHRPRRVQVMYVHPIDQDLFDAPPFRKVQEFACGDHDGNPIWIYSNE
jgi:hypothetical protein